MAVPSDGDNGTTSSQYYHDSPLPIDLNSGVFCDLPNGITADALLEHIIEETYESVDSGGLGASESNHTMKSNFNGALLPKTKDEKQKNKIYTRQYKASYTQQPV